MLMRYRPGPRRNKDANEIASSTGCDHALKSSWRSTSFEVATIMVNVSSKHAGRTNQPRIRSSPPPNQGLAERTGSITDSTARWVATPREGGANLLEDARTLLSGFNPLDFVEAMDAKNGEMLCGAGRVSIAYDKAAMPDPAITASAKSRTRRSAARAAMRSSSRAIACAMIARRR